MSDSIIDKAARVLDEHVISAPNGGTASLAWCTCSCGYQAKLYSGTRDQVASLARRHVAQALADAGLLRPEIDDAMVRRAYAAFMHNYPITPSGKVLPELVKATLREALEAALGGEQA